MRRIDQREPRDDLKPHVVVRVVKGVWRDEDIAKPSSTPTTSASAAWIASTMLSKLTTVPPYSMLNSITSKIDGRRGGGRAGGDANPISASARTAGTTYERT